MAWERNFEKRVLKVREAELKFQRLNYTIEVRSFPFFENGKVEMKRMRGSARSYGTGFGEQTFPSAELYLT